MFKKFMATAITAALMLAAMPAAFAGGGMSGDMIYPPVSSVSFSVSVQTDVKAEKAVIYADYSVYDTESTRKEVLDKLNAAYNKAKTSLSQYGKVNRSGMNIYSSIPYEPMVKEDGTVAEETEEKMAMPAFNGYLNIQITVTDLSKVDAVKDLLLTDLEFNNSWVDFPLADSVLVGAESDVADRVKTLIEDRKAVYEKVLGQKLGAISNLSMSTWADGNTFDAVTGMVKATVSAYVNFY